MSDMMNMQVDYEQISADKLENEKEKENVDDVKEAPQEQTMERTPSTCRVKCFDCKEGCKTCGRHCWEACVAVDWGGACGVCCMAICCALIMAPMVGGGGGGHHGCGC